MQKYLTKRYLAEWKNAQKHCWRQGSTAGIAYVYILGRATDFYMAPDGNKYYLFDTKNVILQNIHVKFCEVVPVAIHGVNRLVAHVVLESDIQPDEYQNVINKIQELCSLDLPMYAVPYAYKIRESFPTSANSNKKDISALAQDFSDWIVAGSSDNDRNLFA